MLNSRRWRAAGPALCLAGLLAFTVGVLGRAAWVMPFWYDESLTVRVSRLQVPGELWRALTAGFEFNPPLIYLATKLARSLPGPETLTARVPGLAGYALLVVSLYRLIRRRVGSWYAVAAVALLPLADYTIRYAIEARPYMLLLGVSGWALLCWQSTAARSTRAAPAGLALATATALLLHVWAIILPLALLAGEAVAWWRARRVRWRVVVPLAVAAPAVALYPVLLRASRTVIFGGPAYAPSLDKLVAAFRADLPRPRVIMAVGVAAVLAAWWGRRRNAAEPPAGGGFEPEETAVLLVLLASPLLPYLYASAAAGAFMTRYGLFALPAAVGLFAGVLHGLGGGRPLAGQAAAVVGLLAVPVYMPPRVPTTGTQSAVVESLRGAGSSLDPSVPLVLVNPVDVTAFDEQADDAVAGRALFVADPDLALAYTGTNGIDLGYVRGQAFLKLRPRQLTYDGLTTTYRRVYLVGKWQALSWLPQKLHDDGWTVTPVGGSRQAPIVEARRR